MKWHLRNTTGYSYRRQLKLPSRGSQNWQPNNRYTPEKQEGMRILWYIESYSTEAWDWAILKDGKKNLHTSLANGNDIAAIKNSYKNLGILHAKQQSTLKRLQGSKPKPNNSKTQASPENSAEWTGQGLMMKTNTLPNITEPTGIITWPQGEIVKWLVNTSLSPPKPTTPRL